MLVTSLAAGASFATQDSLPDSPLHDVKIATEQVRLSLAQSSEDLMTIELAIAQARLREAAALQAQDRQIEAEAAVSAYGEHVANAAAHFGDSAATAGPAALNLFRAQVVRQQQSIPGSSAKATGAAANGTALGIAAEVAATITNDDRVGAREIAVAAANAADKAATSIEKKAAPAPQTAPTSPLAPPNTSTDAPRPSASASTVASPSPATPAPPAPATPPSTTSAQAKTAVPAAESDKAKSDKAKAEAAAKAAREAADRAKLAADRAKQNAEGKTKK